jgi:hypothetical protein
MNLTRQRSFGPRETIGVSSAATQLRPRHSMPRGDRPTESDNGDKSRQAPELSRRPS